MFEFNIKVYINGLWKTNDSKSKSRQVCVFSNQIDLFFKGIVTDIAGISHK